MDSELHLQGGLSVLKKSFGLLGLCRARYSAGDMRTICVGGKLFFISSQTGVMRVEQLFVSLPNLDCLLLQAA